MTKPGFFESMIRKFILPHIQMLLFDIDGDFSDNMHDSEMMMTMKKMMMMTIIMMMMIMTMTIEMMIPKDFLGSLNLFFFFLILLLLFLFVLY